MRHEDFIPLPTRSKTTAKEMIARANDLYEEMRSRRSVRHFSDRAVPREIIETCIRIASTAPSGANRQPWHFVAVSDPATKQRIRQAAEAEEREFYSHRAPDAWLEALRPLGTNEDKPFLEIAPYLIVVFAQLHGVTEEGQKLKHYYVNESVGIATGLLIHAVHHAGLACLTHTPSPMRFLNEILGRPTWERPYLILVVGHPAEDTVVPRLEKKKLPEVATFIGEHAG